MLFRLGHWAARRHWWVIAAWALVLVGSLVAATAEGGKPQDSFSIPGASSQQALELFEQNAPALAAPGAVAVFHTPNGQVTDPANQAAIEASLANLAKVQAVTSVSNPFQLTAALTAMDHGQPLTSNIPGTDIPLDRLLAPPISADGKTTTASIVYVNDFNQIPADTVEQLQAAAAPATQAGVQVSFGGAVVDARNADTGGLSKYADLIGLGIAVIILLIALGSVTGMALPLVNALFSLLISTLLVQLLEAHFEIGSVAPVIATTIGLGVGIDYSLFIVSRFRQNLATGAAVPDAVGTAIATSGAAVLFAAITVCFALVGLYFIGIPYITWLGVVAALFVSVTVTSALTLLPAALGLLGHRIDALRLPWHRPAEGETDEALARSFSARWAAFISKRPALFVVVTLVVLVLLAAPLLRIDLGMPDDATAPASSTQRIAFEQQTQAFGPGVTGPLLVVVQLGGTPGPSTSPSGTTPGSTASTGVTAAPAPGGSTAAPTTATPTTAVAPTTVVVPTTAATPTTAVAPTTAAAPTGSPTTTVPTAAGTPGTAANASAACGAGSATAVTPTQPQEQALLALGGALLKTPGVQRVTPVGVCGTVMVMAVTPTTGPSDGATTDLVNQIRNQVVPTALNGTAISPQSVYIGGQTAILIDLVAQVKARILPYIGVVLLLAVVLLMMVFRSLYVPLNAAVMNLLSIGAAIGLLVAVFQLGWGASVIGVDQKVAIVAVVPVMMFAVLFGLSMDYEVFLLSRIKEEYDHTGDSRQAVIAGVGHTARVITAAALIMISVFGFSAVNPSIIVKMIGFGMAAAVFIDATIVRMMLVPSSMEVVGRACWWFPAWLERILPKIDIEGGDTEPPPTTPPVRT